MLKKWFFKKIYESHRTTADTSLQFRLNYVVLIFLSNCVQRLLVDLNHWPVMKFRVYVFLPFSTMLSKVFLPIFNCFGCHSREFICYDHAHSSVPNLFPVLLQSIF